MSAIQENTVRQDWRDDFSKPCLLLDVILFWGAASQPLSDTRVASSGLP
ncbi:MAG: hypothetical protein VKJ24_11550 [Synechococcales bacterium]|nr:hypothetical protein [Synechococcales bacterium]